MDIVERARVRNVPYGNNELLDKLANEIIRLRAALLQIELVCWREGTQFEKRLIECRGIARDAIVNPYGQGAATPEPRPDPSVD